MEKHGSHHRRRFHGDVFSKHLKVPTNEQNSQLWWHANTEEPHLRNSGLRKEHYKLFWTMLLHRGVWNDDRYIVMKVDAMSRDPRRQRYDWHKRDIMPKCVVSLVRHWFPNPRGFPYI